MSRRPSLAWLAALIAGVLPLTVRAQAVTNLGFEAVSSAKGAWRPDGWGVAGEGYEIVIDSAQHVEGRASLRSRRMEHPSAGAATYRFGVATQSYPVALARGRTLRLSGWIRTEAVAEGYAGLWLRVDAVDTMLHLENMSQRGPRGTTAWTRYVVEAPVDSGATAIYFGVLHPGSGTAWFDSLHVEVVGPAMPRRVASVPPFVVPPRPPEDLTRLLTDAEARLPTDSTPPPAVDTAWATWVREHARPIRSLGATDFADLGFLHPLLAGKRIVQLGESGHGVREFNLAKVRLIKYLHEALGYDVIAFESSLFACDRAGRRSGTLTATALMRACTFGVWHTEEVLDLFAYIKETQRTARPLILTGFDTQASSNVGDRERAAFLRSVVAVADSAYARRVYETDSTFRVEGRALAERERVRLVAFYDSLGAWLGAREPALRTAFPDDPSAPALARQVAISMSAFVAQLASGSADAVRVRDRGMADNLDFVLDELHPKRKVIVWAHNFHIQHRGFWRGATGTNSAGPRTMGTYVAERRRHELYTIGLFMYRGSAAMNDRTVYPVSRVMPGSLEAILHRAPWRYAFVDLAGASPGPGTAWMFRRLPAKQWGRTPELIVPRDEYDGLLFIDRTWPPQYR